MKNIQERLAEIPEVKNFILFTLIGALIVYLTNNYFAVFAPFIIAYVITQLLRPVMVWFQKKLKMTSPISTIICLLLFAITAGLVGWLFGHCIVEGIKYLIDLLSSPTTINNIMSFAQSMGTKFEDMAHWFDMEIDWNEVVAIVGDAIASIIKVLSNFSLNFAMQLPSFLVSLIIGCIAAFYMMADYDKFAQAAKLQMSEKTAKFIDVFNTQVLSSLMKMILSYALLSVICFAELMFGFFVLGIKDAAFIALLIAVLDVLPILGSGGVLVPWGIIMLLMGNPIRGIGLIVLWGIIVVVRQVLEPKVVGKQIGLHPLLTVASLFIGLKLMGALGMIIAPLYILVCKQLNEEGLISLYKTANDTKEEQTLEQDISNNQDKK